MTKEKAEEFLTKLESLLKEYDLFLDYGRTGLEINKCYPPSGTLKIIDHKTEEEWGIDTFVFGWNWWIND